MIRKRISAECIGVVVASVDSHHLCQLLGGGGWIAKWVTLSTRRSVLKGPGSSPGGAEVLGTDGICKYLPVSVSSYVEVCLCLLCSVCIN